MDEKNIQNFITAVGAIAESASLFYIQLIEHDVPEEQATKMTCALIKQLVPTSVPPQD